MKCDRCEQPATIHEVSIHNGARVEQHLCEACARALGGAPVQVPSPAELLAQVLAQKSPRASRSNEPASDPCCPACGLTMARFRDKGMLGCPTCYQAFAPLLEPLMTRAQEGGTRHAGKVPKRWASRQASAPVLPATPAGGPAEPRPAHEPRGTGADPQELIQRAALLKKQLADAIVAEDYERAARLRDQIRQLGVTGPNAGGLGPHGGRA